jgi:hypothetical protein
MLRQVRFWTLLSAAVLAACAAPTVVQSVRPEDASLGCEQLQNEFAEAERFRSEGAHEKGVTRNNVFRAILFWPAVLGTTTNANEAIAAAETRKVHLANQMTIKNCWPVSKETALATPVPKSAPPKVELSKEAQLEELRRLFYLNYVSKGAYTEMKKAINDAP